MNAERLLAHYERIADAPNAVPRLRRFILDLAVRGKLVVQDPNDEPASELLKRAKAMRSRLVKERNIRRSSDHAPIEVDECPFDLPPNWRWAPFGLVAEFSAGRTPARNEPSYWKSGEHAWVSIADMKDGDTITAAKESITKKAATQVFGAKPSRLGTIIMSSLAGPNRLRFQAIGIPTRISTNQGNSSPYVPYVPGLQHASSLSRCSASHAEIARRMGH